MGVTSLSRDGIVANQKYSSALAGNDTADVALSSDFLIQEIVLNGTATSVVFDVSNLASTYKHLQIRINAKSSSTDNSGWRWVRLVGTFNGDTTNSNYAIHQLYGNGGSVYAYAETSSRKGFGLASRNSEAGFSSTVIDILDFANTSKNKTSRSIFGLIGSNSNSDSTVGMFSHLWMSTSAITSITIATEDGSLFKTGSRFSIYGSKG